MILCPKVLIVAFNIFVRDFIFEGYYTILRMFLLLNYLL